jgi:hypothetical protein
VNCPRPPVSSMSSHAVCFVLVVPCPLDILFSVKGTWQVCSNGRRD